MQDYCPKCVLAAKRAGKLIWSDQIIENNASAIERMNRINSVYPFYEPVNFNDRVNEKIIGISDVVTVPNCQMNQAVSRFLSKDGCVEIARYPLSLFNITKTEQKVRLDEQLVILCRSNTARKGGALILRALEILPSEAPWIFEQFSCISVRFLGVMDEFTENVMSTLQLHPKIEIFAREYRFDDLIDYYGCGHMFVMCSIAEGSSLACLEAISVGLKVVITEHCGIDFLDVPEMGEVVELDEFGVAAGIAKVAVKLQNGMASGCFKSQRFSVNYTAQQYSDVVARVVERLRNLTD